jgi:hypothetical protein
MPVVLQLCRLHDEEKRLRDLINKEGFTQLNEETGRSFVHRAYNDLRGIRREMRELWSACYMTPTDRGRAQVKPLEVDPLAEWQAQ